MCCTLYCTAICATWQYSYLFPHALHTFYIPHTLYRYYQTPILVKYFQNKIIEMNKNKKIGNHIPVVSLYLCLSACGGFIGFDKSKNVMVVAREAGKSNIFH